MTDLDAKISAYEAALKALASQQPEDYPYPVFAILKARDGISQALNQEGHVTAPVYQRIGKLDGELKSIEKKIVELVTPATFATWRDLSNPSPDAWWWFLDARASAEEERRSTFLTILAVLFATISLSLITEI